MKAITFFNAFNGVFAIDSERAKATYCNNTEYTAFITEKINKILSNEKQKKQNEYFRVDAIQWTPKADLIDKPEDIHLNKHLWDLETAVEHENNPADWMDEVVKLAHIACPLRVVIGYMPYDKRGEDQRYLDYVSRWLQELKCKDNMQRGEFLVILGNSKTDGDQEKFFHYQGYIFNAELFRFEAISQ